MQTRLKDVCFQVWDEEWEGIEHGEYPEPFRTMLLFEDMEFIKILYKVRSFLRCTHKAYKHFEEPYIFIFLEEEAN